MSEAETASGSNALEAPKSSEIPERSRHMSSLLAKITADGPGQSSKVTEFFRTNLWEAGAKGSQGFEDTVMDKAADLVAPSSSAATLHPKPSGVNAVEAPAPVTPKRSPRLKHQATTPSPVKRTKSDKPKPAEKKTSPKTPGRATKSLPQPPISKKGTQKHVKATKSIKGHKAKEGSVASVALAKATNTLRRSQSFLLDRLREPKLTQVSPEVFDLCAASESPLKRQRPKRCRVPPLQTWRNERFVFERVEGSMTPTLAAVELDMSSPDESSRPRLQLAALQPPLESMHASEYEGISTNLLKSKFFALPLLSSKVSPRTVVLSGVGMIHVLDGSLRFAKEGGREEEIIPAGATFLVKDPGPNLLAPALCAINHAQEGVAGVRFCWVEVKQKHAMWLSSAMSPKIWTRCMWIADCWIALNC